jgi:hypothetical protein
MANGRVGAGDARQWPGGDLSEAAGVGAALLQPDVDLGHGQVCGAHQLDADVACVRVKTP